MTTEETPTVTPEPTSRAADVAWDVMRRVHLGSRRPENWVQLFQFAVVGGTGYVINLIVFALLTEAGGLHHIAAAISNGTPSHNASRCGNRRDSPARTVAMVSTIAAAIATPTRSPTVPGGLPS